MGYIRDRMHADLRLAGLSESTRDCYIHCAKLFVKFFDRSPEELGEEEVRRFLLHLRERNLSVGRYSQYLCALRFLYQVTLQRPEVTDGIPTPKKHRRSPPVMTRDEVARVFAAATTPFWRVFLVTAYAAGLRREEATHLRAENIHAAAGLIHVVHAKGDKPRDVMLDPELLQQLRAHWRRHELPGPWLFPARARNGWANRPVNLRRASGAFRKAADRAGLTRRMTLHSLRTAFATHLLEDGADVFTLQQLLGHEHLETTANYARVRTDRIRSTPSPLSTLPK